MSGRLIKLPVKIKTIFNPGNFPDLKRTDPAKVFHRYFLCVDPEPCFGENRIMAFFFRSRTNKAAVPKERLILSIDGGGIDKLSVADNGSGIRRDDLPLLGSRHATSKIHTQDDLYDIHTLGFRGEALYSIGAVSRLTISTYAA